MCTVQRCESYVDFNLIDDPPESGIRRRRNIIRYATYAAKRLGKSRTKFVLDTMREASENVLLDQRLFLVEAPVFDAFEAALDSPREPNGGLRRTLTSPAPWDR